LVLLTMSYSVKEIYYTLQGEGAQTGRAAVFCRFAGCNLWSGREADRAEAICRFCDTDFVGVDGPGGGRFDSAEDLAAAIERKWPADSSLGKRFVVCTGGEPLLQLDAKLIAAPQGVDWLTVSPKAGAELKQRSGEELKLVFPQLGVDPAEFEALSFRHFFLQPMDGPSREAYTELALRYCLAHPQWRLSLQTHKLLGIP
jgi:organic radical activating enzyme